MKKVLYTILGILIVSATTATVVQYYSFIFSKVISGEVIRIARLTDPSALIVNGGQIPSNQIFSFSIAIQTPNGEIITSSSEDRQWAVVDQGRCAEARIFPYPPWNLSKGGTYYDARLMKMYQCPAKDQTSLPADH